MSAPRSSETRWVDAVAGGGQGAHDLGRCTARLEGWLDHLADMLNAQRPALHGLAPDHALAVQVQAVRALLDAQTRRWPQQRTQRAPARALADRFGDMAVLLVFGKINAGKSAFCNLLAERFIAHGATARYFRLEAGCVVDMPEPFEEGATETTSRIQGVLLGERLALLDTPGLHSVSEENAELTLCYTESADGVLWLSSSTAPGQVQELDQLRRELQRRKPLLPVITRSDVYEEDEVDGQIRKVLRNKSDSNRAQQEGDVEARARQKLQSSGLDPALVLSPVSVSVYAAREHGACAEAMAAAGFERLYRALLGILEPALAYKRRKPAELLLHHLQEDVLDALQSHGLRALDQLDSALQEALSRLEQSASRIVRAAGRTLTSGLPALLEEHASSRDVSGMWRTLTGRILDAFRGEAQVALAGYGQVLDRLPALVEAYDGPAYEQHVIHAEGGDVVVGVSYERLHAALEAAIYRDLSRLAEHVVERCRATVRRLMQESACLRAGLAAAADELAALEREIRQP